MTKKMVVIGQYPDKETAKDGMMQRVLEMDDIFRESHDIIYLDISFKSHWVEYQENVSYNGIIVDIWHLNMFLHQSTILNFLLKADVVYVHSVMNYFLAFSALTATKCPILLDIHGVVPEEYAFSGKKFKGFLYSIAEYFAFKKSKYFIAVTRAMREYYLLKYRWLAAEKFIILPIFDKPGTMTEGNLASTPSDTTLNNMDCASALTIVYAGGTQAWQNIDYMVKFAMIFGNVFNFRFYVPLQAISDVKGGLESSAVVESLTKSELMIKYRECDLGFLLRDDIAVNKVASPTKFSEYVNSYIVPIMFDKNVGDIEHYEYNIIRFDDLIALRMPDRDELRAMAVENKRIYDTIYMNDVSKSYRILVDKLSTFSPDKMDNMI